MGAEPSCYIRAFLISSNSSKFLGQSSLSNRDKLRSVGQEYSALEAIVGTIGQLREAEKRLADARELQQGDDADLRDLAREEPSAAMVTP